MSRPPLPLPAVLPWHVFTSAEARRAGVSQDRLKRKDISRIRRGLFSRTGPPVSEAAIVAALSRQDGSAVVVGPSAARLWNMPLPPQLGSWDSRKPVHLSIPGGRNSHGAVVRWHDFTLAEEDVQRLVFTQVLSFHETAPPPHCSLRMTTRSRTWRDLARHLTHGQLVAVGDHLVRAPRPQFENGRRKPWCSLEQLAKACTGRYAASLRRALTDVRRGADSPMETMLRLAFIDAGLPEPLINMPLIGPDGVALHTPDFQWPQYRVCAEYEGAAHNKDQQVKRDIRRARRVKAARWSEIRLYKDDAHAGCAAAVHLVREELRARGWRP